MRFFKKVLLYADALNRGKLYTKLYSSEYDNVLVDHQVVQKAPHRFVADGYVLRNAPFFEQFDAYAFFIYETPPVWK